MAVGKMYTNALLKALNKEIDWDSDNIKVMLTTSAYVPNQDTHIYKSSITNEVVGTGYTARGQALASKTIVAGTKLITLDGADTTWAASTITARYAVVYEDTGTDGTSALLGYVDMSTDQVSSNGNFTVQWDSAGIFTITIA